MNAWNHGFMGPLPGPKPEPTWDDVDDEEKCDHGDDTECGHCIDCGKYIGSSFGEYEGPFGMER